MSRTQAILLMTALAGALVAPAQTTANTAELTCTPTSGDKISLDLLAFNFSTTQLIDPNTASPTGKISSSLRFEIPFTEIYRTLQGAAAGNEKFPTCTLLVTAQSTGGRAPRWVISNAVLTDLAVEGEEGSSGSTNVVGTLTFTSVDFGWPASI